MECCQTEQWRAALSAIIDGEDPAIPRVQVDEHLAQCAACSEWFDRAQQQAVGVRALPGPRHDLTDMLIGVTEAHICSCHTGGQCECTNCACPTCTCHDVAS